MAALIAAPAEIPTRMPSFGPIKRAVSNASSLETAATFDKRWCLKLLGQNQRLFLGFYVDLVRHLLKQATPLVTATISMSGKIRFNSWPTPVTVPPVPTPETNASKPRLPKTSTISFPVFVHVPLD